MQVFEHVEILDTSESEAFRQLLMYPRHFLSMFCSIQIINKVQPINIDDMEIDELVCGCFRK